MLEWRRAGVKKQNSRAWQSPRFAIQRLLWSGSTSATSAVVPYMHSLAFFQFAPPLCWSLIILRICASEKLSSPSRPPKSSSTSFAIASSKATIDREKRSPINSGVKSQEVSLVSASRKKSRTMIGRWNATCSTVTSPRWPSSHREIEPRLA